MKRTTMRQFLESHPNRDFQHRTRRTLTTREMTNFYSASLDAQVIYDEESGEVSFWSPCAEIVGSHEEKKR